MGSGYLRRIAEFVKPDNVSTEDMIERLRKMVQEEGGYGQKAVVVTSTDRYFGALAVEDW